MTLAILGVWVILEYFRLSFGYLGNINESFSEIVAFVAFSFFFVIPLAVAPVIMVLEESDPPFLPHEKTCIAINVVFTVLEFFLALSALKAFYYTQSAVFFLRTAPILDKKFQQKYSGSEDIQSGREIQLGMQKYDKSRDAFVPFPRSDELLKVHDEDEDLQIAHN